MFARIQKYIYAVICLSFSGHIFAVDPTTSTASSSTHAASTSAFIAKMDAKKTQILSGSGTKNTSGQSSASSAGAQPVPDDKSLMDDVAPLKLIQSLVRLHEYERRQETELKELQKTRAVIEKRITQMQARLEQLNKDIPGYADAVQNLVKDPQKKAEWQSATTKMYVAVAQSERLKQLLQRYTGTIKKLDASKLAAKLVAAAQGGTGSGTSTKKTSTIKTTVAKPVAATPSTTSTTTTAAPATESAASTSGSETAPTPDAAEPDLMTELDGPTETAATS